MGYGSKQLIRITLPEFDFGGGAAETYKIPLPKKDNGVAMQAQVSSIGISVTETFADDTTTASFAVGTATDDDAYAKLNIPDTTADNTVFNEDDDTDAIISDDITSGDIQITLTNGTDSGTVAGKGIPYLDLWCW